VEIPDKGAVEFNGKKAAPRPVPDTKAA